MASSSPSKTSNAATASSPSVNLQQGSTDPTYYEQPVIRNSQELQFLVDNPNSKRIFGFLLRSCSLCIAVLLVLEGMVLLGLGIGFLVHQQSKRKEISPHDHSIEDYIQAWVFAGAFFVCRGILYFFSAAFLGVSVYKPYLSACSCWLVCQGVFLACAWIVTVIGVVIYGTTVGLRVLIAVPMILSAIDMIGMYIVWAYTKELEVAEYVKMTLDEMHRRFPSASSNHGYMPYGLEITSSQSYQVIMDENMKANPDETENDKAKDGKPPEKQGVSQAGDDGKGPVNKGQQQKDPDSGPKKNDNKNNKGPAPNAPANKPVASDPQPQPTSSPPQRGNDIKNNPVSSPANKSAPAADPPKAASKEKAVDWGPSNTDEEDAAAAAARERRRKKVPKTKSLRRSFE